MLPFLCLTNWSQFFYPSVLLLMINCVITLSKWLWNHDPQWSASAANCDNVTANWIFKKRARQPHKKLMSICFFKITRPETGQMVGINKVFKMQVWCIQEAHLHSAAHASLRFQILSVWSLIDYENKPISTHEIGQLL